MSRLGRTARSAAVVLAAAGLAAAPGIWSHGRHQAEEQSYQVREVQEGLTTLHRDLMTVTHFASDKTTHHDSDLADYLAVRRDAFGPVRWLGVIGPDGGKAQVLLASAEARGYDPRRDAAVAPLLGTLGAGEIAAAIPATHRNMASLALVLGPLGDGRTSLVALVNGDDLLDDSLRAMNESTSPFTLSWQGTPVGHWPHTGRQEAVLPAMSLPVAMAALDFSVDFAAADWREGLYQIAPLPLTALLTGGATMIAMLLFGAAAPRSPAGPLPAPPPHRPPAVGGHRGRLWQLGELAATLAHDLGQPLNVIRLSAEAAADALEGDRLAPERLGRTLATVVEQTQRARAMLDAVAGATRRPRNTAATLHPVEAVRRVLARNLARLKDQGLRLVWHADLSTPVVSGHAHRLEAAVHHLLINACETLTARHLDSGSAGTVWVECRPDGDQVLIVVADDGPGMPPALRAALADPDAAPQGVGAGLGLTVVLGVAEEMDGTLVIADNPGGGTRAMLRLPAHRRSLLLVDDDTVAATTLAEALTATGWRVRVAHGGNPALALFRTHRADAVVTDLHMADGDGWGLIEMLRAQDSDLPIIAMSSAEGAEAQRAVTAGAAMVLRKPLAARDISAALDEVLFG